MTQDLLQDDWRELAVNQALRSSVFEGGMPAHTLLEQIRTHLPGSHTLTVMFDRVLLLRFLREQTTHFRSLLSGSDLLMLEGKFNEYTGWYAVEWEGVTLEAAFEPGGRHLARTILIGSDQDQLRRFGALLESYTNRPTGRCLIYSRQWKDAPEMDAEIGKVTWEDIVLPAAVIAGVREAVEGFIKHRHAFDTLGFPWRRGLLLIGPPGTGKTMLCKAAASALPALPFLYVRDFQSDQRMTAQSAVHNIFERARKLAPCLLAFEDIDGMVTSSNRSLFLNELDGWQDNTGLLVIASSNHPGKIDEALLKRPSRFDRVFHIGLPAQPERRTYCAQLLSRSGLTERMTPDLDRDALAAQVAERTEGFTPAYLKEVFVAAALRQAQEGLDQLGASFAEAVLVQVEELRHHLQQLKDADSLGEFVSPDAAPVGIRRNRG